MNSINRLQEVLKKPNNPHFAINDLDKWKDVESRLNTSFPSDFKDFISYYGTGVVGNFILIFNPFSTYTPANFFTNMEFVLRLEQEFRDLHFPLFPETGGILPFAKTHNGDHIFWLTQGSPDSWSLIVKLSESGYHEVYPYGIGDLLLNLIIGSSDFNEDILINSRIFKGSF